MATLAQANAYNTARGNTRWSELDAEPATALLQDAEDYIRSAYAPIRDDLTIDEERIFDGLVCRLASVFQINPPQVASAPAVKKQTSELKGMKKEVEYEAAASDPYPYVTAVIGRFVAKPAAVPPVTMGRLRR